MGFTADLTAGLAQFAADNGIGAWRPTGVYEVSETAIIPAQVPAQPDRLVAITLYLPIDDETQPETVQMVQFRTRGPRGDVRFSENLQDAIFDVFHNLPRSEIGGVTVAGCWRRSGSYLGVDDNGRHEHSSNYEFRQHRPSPHRN